MAIGGNFHDHRRVVALEISLGVTQKLTVGNLYPFHLPVSTFERGLRLIGGFYGNDKSRDSTNEGGANF